MPGNLRIFLDHGSGILGIGFVARTQGRQGPGDVQTRLAGLGAPRLRHRDGETRDLPQPVAKTDLRQTLRRDGVIPGRDHIRAGRDVFLMDIAHGRRRIDQGLG